MTFYLKPPRGKINLYKLQDCIKQRITFYENLDNHSELDLTEFDCLIEDSGFDRTGHFMFRIYAFIHSSFREIFIGRECKLLQIRLSFYDNTDFKYFTKKLLQHTKDILKSDQPEDDLQDFLTNLIQVCLHFLRKDYLKHMQNHEVSNECDMFELKVPFDICPNLLVNRNYNIKNGEIQIPCTDQKILFIALYNRFLIIVLREMRHSVTVDNVIQDQRISTSLKLIGEHYFSYDAEKSALFNIKEIDNESSYFPLCMQILYGTLKKNNRLSHNARFDFSLYLKDLGTTLSESMKFWELMYSKQHATCSKCTHSWQENEKKYIYGIRHMYGLEGARRNYSARSCQNLQERSLTATEEGGCPFRHSDDENLRRILKSLLPSFDDPIEVIIYERKENPSESCKLFFENFLLLKKREFVGDIKFSSPVQYYQLLKGHVK